MKIIHRQAISVAGLTAVAVLGLSACSNDSSTAAPASVTSSTMAASSAAPKPMDQPVDSGASLVGPGCADYAAQNPTGPGSVTGMAQDPVAVAASNNPLLTTLTAAVSGKLNPNVNLVDTLNGSEFTVFAPTDAAFAKIDPATIEKLKTDSNLLSSILTYHVVPGKVTAAEVTKLDEAKTANGQTVNIKTDGGSVMVNDAKVITADIPASNGIIHVIDTVILPPRG